MNLKLDWCAHRTARRAVECWHYSRSMPAGKVVSIGVWEDGAFIGAIIFGRGANQYIGKAYGLTQWQCCELVRVALREHQTPVSRILAIAIRMLKRKCPGLRLIVSYADCDQEHHGGIYAAGGWLYSGQVQTGGGTPKFKVRDRVMHGRSVHAKYGTGAQRLPWLRQHVDPYSEKVWTDGKHKYLMALDPQMQKQIAALKKPYPKRAGSESCDTSAPPG